jgi:hypothetical protein
MTNARCTVANLNNDQMASLSPDLIDLTSSNASLSSMEMASSVMPPPTSSSSKPRRTSGRKRTSTTMIIDGHVVKTSNNYVVTGVNYVHGAYKADKPTKKPAAFRPI